MAHKSEASAQAHFRKLFQCEGQQDALLLMDVLEKRLPRSCFMYNQLKAYPKFKEDLSWYSYRYQANDADGNDDESSLWIISKFMREDWGSVISISPPTSSFEQDGLPACVEHALQHSDCIDWTQRFVLLCVDLHVSDFLIKLNTRTIGNVVKIFPTYLFCMDPEEALKLDLSPRERKGNDPSFSVELASMEPEKDAQFLGRLWTYTRPGTEQFLAASIKKLISAGVYVKSKGENGEKREPVSGAILPGYGLLSSLVTHPDHRRKGYAGLATKFIYKQMASEGYYPCLDAEIMDAAAVGFHTSLNGHRIISKVDYIAHKAL